MNSQDTQTSKAEHEESQNKFGALAKDEHGRVTKYRTKKGVLIYRPVDKKGGQAVHRDYFMLRVVRGGKQHYFPLPGETTQASKIANDIDSFLSVRSNTMEEALKRFGPSKPETPAPNERCPSVGELIEAFFKVGNRLTDRTKQEYATALRRISASICKLPAQHRTPNKVKLEKWRSAVNNLPVDRITPQKLEELRNSILRSAGDDETQKARAVVTANAILRNAGAIFSNKMRRLYSEFRLPEPDPFRMVEKLEERIKRYSSQANIAELVNAAREELKEICPREYVVFVLSLFGGLRRREIDRLIWDQIDFVGEHIWIRTTRYFRSKARNSDSRIDCPSHVFDYLKKFKCSDMGSPFVVPGGDPNSKIRCRKIFRSLSIWLREKGVTEVKALHSLRKEAGSLVFHETGSTDKAAEFLRNDPRTAREYYLGRKGRLEVNIPHTNEA